MYSAIIFDFGNTLAASVSLTQALRNLVDKEKALIAGAKIEQEIDALYQPDQSLQPDWKDIWQRSFDLAGLPFSEQIGRRHLEMFCQSMVLFPNVAELLNALKGKGITLGLLSNVTGPHDIFQKDLDSRGLTQYFDSVVWSSDVGYRKPSRNLFEIMLANLGVDAKNTLMIGDSEIADIAGATQVGMDTARVSKEGNTKTTALFQVATHRLYDDIMAILQTNAAPLHRS